jgi:uncharacterized protein (DUF58 family)
MTDLELSPIESRMLRGLRLEPRRSFPGRVRGERLGERKGVSIDFADFREYAEGDDLRHLDWNVLARLGHAVVKTYQEEEDLPVHLLVDASASMAFGSPSKLEAAARAANALGHVALQGGDVIHRHRLGHPGPREPALRGRASAGRLRQWLSRLEATGGKGLAEGIRAFASSGRSPGLCVIVTDGLDPGVAAAVKALGERGHEVWFVQVLSEVELDPDVEGDLVLVDSESGAELEMTANSLALSAYRTDLEQHIQGIVEACRRAGGRHALVRAGRPLVDFLRDPVRKDGWAV